MRLYDEDQFSELHLLAFHNAEVLEVELKAIEEGPGICRDRLGRGVEIAAPWQRSKRHSLLCEPA
jgi:hypothetical protein